MSNTHYVYSLKYTREKPARIFYIGKGTGSSAADHLKKVDDVRKGKFIQEILDSGTSPVISRVVENLTEEQAFQIGLKLICSFGTIDNGGSLYNSVIPKCIKRKIDKNMIVPIGAVEKAQLGLKLIKDAITSQAQENPDGITNSDCAYYLGLQSVHQGKQQHLLTYSVLGLLLKKGVLEIYLDGNRREYKKCSSGNLTNINIISFELI